MSGFSYQELRKLIMPSQRLLANIKCTLDSDTSNNSFTLCDDVNGDGSEYVGFVRHVVYASDGSIDRTYDTTLGLDAEYVVVGTVGFCPSSTGSGSEGGKLLTLTSTLLLDTTTDVELPGFAIEVPALTTVLVRMDLIYDGPSGDGLKVNFVDDIGTLAYFNLILDSPTRNTIEVPQNVARSQVCTTRGDFSNFFYNHLKVEALLVGGASPTTTQIYAAKSADLGANPCKIIYGTLEIKTP